MEKSKKPLSRDAKPGETPIKGTISKPDLTTSNNPRRHDPTITVDHCEHRNLRVCDRPEAHAGATP